MSTLAVGTIKSVSSEPPVFQNTSGTEKGQLVKAWANFDQTGSQSIRDSFNVSSVTDVSVGTSHIVFTNAMSNTNYCGVIYNNTQANISISGFANQLTGGMVCDTDKIQLSGYNGSSFVDSGLFTVIVIGDN